MNGGWRYRLAGVFGTAAVSLVAVWIANQPLVRSGIDLLPLLRGLPTDHAVGAELAFEAGTAALILLGAFAPLYKPRPRRILDTWMLGVRRVAIAVLALATVGYFDYTYRLPRATLIVTAAVLVVALPAYFVAIRRRPRTDGDRTVVVGDDPATMADVLAAVEGDVIGYVSPPTRIETDGASPRTARTVADGGAVGPELGRLECLGGLSRLDEVLVDHDVDTAVLAFDHTDRGEFFGALDSCYEHGVAAKVHRDHADVVLTRGVASGDLVEIDLEPWDPQDHVIKRAFDVCFAAGGLLALAPVALAVAVAIKLEDDGPVLYPQQRTAAFGDTFTIYKFRSMVPDAEDETGARLSDEDRGGVDPRVTRVGRLLRPTHLDEIPQLWSILVGDMSVVGPRPERPGLDVDMEVDAAEWPSRWFVEPGLTGLAQINGVTGYDPEAKLRYDVEYIREQSFWFDLKIVIRQLWLVGVDVVRALRGADDER